LSLRDQPFNKVKGGICTIGISENSGYPVEEDRGGNSLLTGEGAEVKGTDKRFTLADIEVF
jgi:hypothetical protein